MVSEADLQRGRRTGRRLALAAIFEADFGQRTADAILERHLAESERDETAAALARAGLTLDDIDVIELNEAFAAQVLACLREWHLDATDERLNPNGSGISLGHPVGATGARILATLAHEMQRRGARYGLETMCIGGGQGLAAVFERVDPSAP